MKFRQCYDNIYFPQKYEMVNVNFGYLNHGLVKEVITVRNEVAKVMFLRLSVSHSVHGGVLSQHTLQVVSQHALQQVSGEGSAPGGCLV